MTGRLLVTALAAGAAVLASATPAAASCANLPPAELREQADVIFKGRVLAVKDGKATFRVAKYVKGSGGDRVRVDLGPGGGNAVSSVDLVVREGQRWRIQAQKTRKGKLRTNACAGSRRLT